MFFLFCIIGKNKNTFPVVPEKKVTNKQASKYDISIDILSVSFTVSKPQKK
jgi:hypothetical protein